MPASTAPWRRRRGRWRGPLPFLGGLLALYLLVPIGVLLYHLATGSGTAPSPGLGSAVWISLLTATISTAIIAVFGIPLAWVLAQGRSRAWSAIGVAVQLPLALPPLMSGILLIEVFGPYTLIGRLTGGRLTDTTAAIVVAQTFVAAPFLVIAARSAFETVDERLTEVAATLGHGGLARFWRVSLPLAGPGIRAGLLLSWLRAFGEFGATVILAYHPYSLPVFTFVQFSSTGLPTALPPTGMAILAAAVVLVVTMWRPERLLKALLRRAQAGARPYGRDPARAATRPQGRDGARAPTSPDHHDPAQAPTSPDHHNPARAPTRNESRDAAPGGPAATTPAELHFDLRTTVGTFQLALRHAGASRHLALLGPSGAGKSLTLRCLAGLRPGDVGEVRLGERELGSLPAERRRVGWVPQDAALIPHLDVWRQVTFGVRADPAVAAHWLRRLRIAELRERLPHELSGGQRQRVALARALASQPDLLLLDEPFSALDRPVREELRRELRRLQREIGIATVLVTHDPEEAAMLADEVIVIADGHRLQSGPRDAVFTRPASEAVARLLAIDNLREGRIDSSGELVSSKTRLAVEPDAAAPGSAVRWCIRAERVLLAEPGEHEPQHAAAAPALGHVAARGALGPAAGGRAALSSDGAASSHRAMVEDMLELGGLRELIVALDGGLRLTARAPAAPWQRPGATCTATLRACDITLWADGAQEAPDGPDPAQETATPATGSPGARRAGAGVVWPCT